MKSETNTVKSKAFLSGIDGASAVILETAEYFNNTYRTPIIGQNFSEILLDDNAYEDYIDHLSEGLEIDNVPLFKQLLRSARIDTLQESALSTISPVASVAPTMLRKFFPKLVLKDSMPTEVAKTPRWMITASIPYYIDKNGVEHELPKYIKDQFVNGQNSADLEVYNGVVSLSVFSNEVDLFRGTLIDGTTPVKEGYYGDLPYDTDLSVPFKNAVSLAKLGVDRLDPKFQVGTVRISLLNGYEDDKGTKRKPELDTTIDLPVRFICDMNGNIYGKINFTIPQTGAIDTPSLGLKVKNPTTVSATRDFCTVTGGYVESVTPGKVISGVITGHVEFDTHSLVLTSAGAPEIVGVGLVGKVSSEFNNFGGSVTFKITKREVVIGTAEHINIPLTQEYLKDLQAMYNIDGHLKLVDLMSTYIAQNVELQAYQFLNNSYKYNRLGIGGAGWYGEFNCFPPREFAGRPQDWLEEIKRVIDYFATKMRQSQNYPGGKFVIWGSPVDVNILRNITWQYQANEPNAEKEGVEVNYSIGTWSGTNTYTVISSENIPDGELYLFFYPSSDEQMTYKYYPYTFNMDGNYRDPQRPNVPGFMATKRHTFEEFIPLQARIKIINNRGALPPRVDVLPPRLGDYPVED